MALNNLKAWNDEEVSSACGAADTTEEAPAACGAAEEK